ncbi:MAG: PAS domain-containing sensor histidine kinase [Candidatus Kapaibacteriales bacterium]
MLAELLNPNLLLEIYNFLPHPLCIRESKNLRFIFLNKPFLDLIGKQFEDVVNKTYFDILPPIQAEENHKIDLKILELKNPLKIINNWKFQSQISEVFETHKIPLKNSATGNVEYIIDILQNLTPQVQADELIREIETKYLKLLDYLPIGLLLARESDFMVLEVNNAFLQIFELEFDKVVYKNLFELPIIKNLEGFKNYLLSAKELQTLETMEASVVLSTGKKVQILINIAYIRFLEQEPIVVLIVNDVTLLYEAKNRITDAINREQEYSVMKNRLISTIMHQLRTPLTGITLNLSLLEKYSDTWTKEEKEKYYNRIRNSVNFLVNLIEKTLTLSKVEGDKFPFNPKRLKLKKLLDENVERILPAFPQQDKVIVNFNIENDEITADETLLNLIISNLISNALKFSPSMNPPQVEVDKSNDDIIIRFRNYGTSISQNELKNIFNPFFRGSNAENTIGFGLGLSIVKKCVDSHNGSIEVVSNETDGTIFTVRLPNTLKTNHL